MDGTIFNSRGVHVAFVLGTAIFDLKGQKIYDLRGVNIYKLSGELVGHLTDAPSTKRHLDKSTDKLFPKVRRGLLICDDCQALTGGFRAFAACTVLCYAAACDHPSG